MFHERQDLRRRPSVMNVGVRQSERIKPARLVRSENLRDGATAVVADQINLFDPKCVQDFGDGAISE
jgi:hypothetical protein